MWLTPAPFAPRQPTEFYQFDLDSLDQNGVQNRAGKLLGKLKPKDNAPSTDALQVRPTARWRLGGRADSRGQTPAAGVG